MMKIGITGAAGMIGWHLRSFLEMKGVSQIKIATRETFKSKKALTSFVKNTDVIIHLACQCKGNDLIEVNNKIDQSLTNIIDELSCNPHLIFSSSTHIDINKLSEYAQSKVASSNYFKEWSKNKGIKFTNLIVPHVFGETGKPFHNSVVSTFCHQLANGEKIELLVDKKLELIHSQKLSELIYEIAVKSTVGEILIPGEIVKVSQVMSKLILFNQKYRENTIPILENDFDVDLFNTYRSYLPSSYYPVYFENHFDDRGSFYELSKTLNGGQCNLSTTKIGITRGNHYHHEKIERFVVLAGKAKISLRKKYQNDVVEYIVDGDIPSYVDIPTFYIHNIENIGDSEMMVFFWTHQLFDSNNPDTFYEEV
jgi:UDP-2-acetamido-2,6-beta-L-arabino-hexul-4-ose reductase